MPSDYTGTTAPSDSNTTTEYGTTNNPAPAESCIVSLPVDGDSANAGSLYQPLKTLANWVTKAMTAAYPDIENVWSALQTFGAGIVANAVSAADAAIGIEGDDTVGRRLWLRFAMTGTNDKIVRIYQTNDYGLEITVNAKYESGAWYRDVSGVWSQRLWLTKGISGTVPSVTLGGYPSLGDDGWATSDWGPASSLTAGIASFSSLVVGDPSQLASTGDMAASGKITALDGIIADLNLWTQSTFYSVGARVVAGAKAYECTTAGTSANSGSGPTATGTNISDGTGSLKWAYRGAYTAPTAKAGDVTALFDVTARHFTAAVSTATAAVNSNGTGTATAGSDVGGEVAVEYTATYSGGGPWARISFGTPYVSAPAVVICPVKNDADNESAASAVGGFFVSTSTTGFEIRHKDAAPVVGTTYKWKYVVVG